MSNGFNICMLWNATMIYTIYVVSNHFTYHCIWCVKWIVKPIHWTWIREQLKWPRTSIKLIRSLFECRRWFVVCCFPNSSMTVRRCCWWCYHMHYRLWSTWFYFSTLHSLLLLLIPYEFYGDYKFRNLNGIEHWSMHIQSRHCILLLIFCRMPFTFEVFLPLRW